MSNICEIGGIHRLKELLVTGNILLVTGKESFKTSGAKKALESQLSMEIESVTQFSDFSINPKFLDALKGAELARNENIQMIVAVGGGSVIDMAKLIKAFIKNAGSEAEIVMGVRKFSDPKIPLIAIPTTAGSGSESTHFAVVYKDNEKYSLADECLLPDRYILDGNLIGSGSNYQKKCQALDALAQSIESAWAIGSTEISRADSFNAISKLWKLIPEVMNRIDYDPNEMQELLEGANLAGKAINVSKTTAAHAWSYAITGQCGLPHGHAVWITLPKIFQIHANALEHEVVDPRGLEHLRNVMNNICKLLGIENPKNAKLELEKFLTSLGLDYEFNVIGLPSEEERLNISRKVNEQRLSNNPVSLLSHTPFIFDYNNS